MRAAPSAASRSDHGRDQDLPGDGGQTEPQRHGAVDHHGDHGGPDQDPVGRRVEHLAEGRDLAVAPGHEAVDPVRRAEDGQQHGGRRLPVHPEEQPQEDRDAQEAHQGDDVGSGEDPVQAVVVHAPSLGSAPRRPRLPCARVARCRVSNRSGACATGPRSHRWPRSSPRPTTSSRPTERAHLASRHRANAVLVELPEADLRGGRDRYAVATDLFTALAGEGGHRRRPGPEPLPLPHDRPVGARHHRRHRRARPGRAGRGERHPAPRADAAQAEERPSGPAAGHAGQPLPHLGPLHGGRRHGHVRPDRRRAGGRRLRRRRGPAPALGAQRRRRGGGGRRRGGHRAGGPRRRPPPLRDRPGLPGRAAPGQRRHGRVPTTS